MNSSDRFVAHSSTRHRRRPDVRHRLHHHVLLLADLDHPVLHGRLVLGGAAVVQVPGVVGRRLRGLDAVGRPAGAERDAECGWRQWHGARAEQLGAVLSVSNANHLREVDQHKLQCLEDESSELSEDKRDD